MLILRKGLYGPIGNRLLLEAVQGPACCVYFGIKSQKFAKLLLENSDNNYRHYANYDYENYEDHSVISW